LSYCLTPFEGQRIIRKSKLFIITDIRPAVNPLFMMEDARDLKKCEENYEEMRYCFILFSFSGRPLFRFFLTQINVYKKYSLYSSCIIKT